MEKISEICGILCFTVITMNILYSFGFFPATEKVVKFVFSIFIVLTIIKAIQSTDTIVFDFSFQQENGQHYKEDFMEIVCDETEKKAEEIITKRLDEKNISYNYLSVHIMEQNDTLTADRIVIRCDNKDILSAEQCISDFVTEDTVIEIGE